MRTTWKPLTFLLSLTFLFLFSGSVYGDDLEDATAAANKGDFKTAYKLLLPRAEQGLAEAQVNLGILYHGGDGVPQNYKEAVKWFRLAAEQGDASGQFMLGLAYNNGRGVPQDYKEAVKWYRLAAEQGDASGQAKLGFMYYHGTGVPQDYASAHMLWNICGSGGDKKCVKLRNLVEQQMTPSQIEKAQEMARNWKPTKK